MMEYDRGGELKNETQNMKHLVSPLQRNYYRNFKVTEVDMRKGSGTSVKIS
jgi:hypothetical protein